MSSSSRKKIAKQRAAYLRKNRKKIAKQRAAYRRKNRKKIARQYAAYRRKNRKKIAKRMAAYIVVYRCTLVARHSCLLKRHNRELAPRGVSGQPMSLKAHQKRLYFADGRERPCWYCSGENNKTGSGLDRLNNNTTYTVKNTVPCCRGCNVWRGSTHSVRETRDHFKPMRDAVKRLRGSTTR